ncbi:MAG: hypothetical protein CVV02_01670 [Firmicutes bacterium HGW-Firmicutes-7]|nr:MAG: hypothetical protein CVV02_01670 [Firmicutes bacterium HGW-Firmicutes-7]
MSIQYKVDNYDDEQKIWRYMDFTKFISLIESSSLFLSRADFMSDPYEGSYTSIGKSMRKELYSGVSDKVLNGLEKVHEKIKQYVYLNCWHANNYESAAMWTLYLKSNEGIAIQTTLKDLQQSLVNTDGFILNIRDVKYIDYINDKFDETNILNAFLYKRKSFEHENEVRLLRGLFHYSLHEEILNDPDNLIMEGGFNIDVKLDTLINNIYIAPDAPKWFHNIVIDILKRYDKIYNINLSTRVKKSDLSNDPMY